MPSYDAVCSQCPEKAVTFRGRIETAVWFCDEHLPYRRSKPLQDPRTGEVRDVVDFGAGFTTKALEKAKKAKKTKAQDPTSDR